MDTQNPVPDPAAHGMTRYDTDPDALAWARTRVQHYIERITRFEEQATESSSDKARGLRVARRSAEQTLIGGEGCVVGAFDVRRPQMFAGVTSRAVAEGQTTDPAARLEAIADTPQARTNGPIHGWFSLSYCNYAVLQRTLMQCMPVEWQERMVACLRELDDAFEGVPQAEGYEVHAATEHEICDLDDEQRAALGITEDWYGGQTPPADLDPADLAEWESEHEDPEGPVYRNADGEEVDGGDRVLLRCEDPIPHYRHAPYIEPRVAALQLDDPPTTGGKTTPNPLRQLVDDVAAQLHDEDPATYHGDGGPADCKRCAATGGEQA